MQILTKSIHTKYETKTFNKTHYNILVIWCVFWQVYLGVSSGQMWYVPQCPVSLIIGITMTPSGVSEGGHRPIFSGSCKDKVRTFSAAEKFNRLGIFGEAMMISLIMCRQFTWFLCEGSGPYFPTLQQIMSKATSGSWDWSGKLYIPSSPPLAPCDALNIEDDVKCIITHVQYVTCDSMWQSKYISGELVTPATVLAGTCRTGWWRARPAGELNAGPAHTGAQRPLSQWDSSRQTAASRVV